MSGVWISNRTFWNMAYLSHTNWTYKTTLKNLKNVKCLILVRESLEPFLCGESNFQGWFFCESKNSITWSKCRDETDCNIKHKDRVAKPLKNRYESISSRFSSIQNQRLKKFFFQKFVISWIPIWFNFHRIEVTMY